MRSANELGRSLTTDDKVTVVNADGTLTTGVPAALENVAPNPGEVAPTGLQDTDQVLVVVVDQGNVYRVLETYLRLVQTDGAKNWLRGSEILGFAKTFDGAKRYIAVLSERRSLRVNPGGAVLEQNVDALRTGTTTDPTSERARLNYTWNNCGRTAANLSQALADLQCLKALPEYMSRDFKADAVPALMSELAAFVRDGNSYLIDISFSGIHTFTLECHADGNYLVQGYQGAYSAFWWQGLTEHPLALPGAKPDESQLPDNWATFEADTIKRRKAYGKNSPLKDEQIIELLVEITKMFALANDGLWTEAAHEAYLKLPFYPGQSALDTTGETEFEKAKRSTLGESDTHPPAPKSMGLTVNIWRIVESAELGSTTGHSRCHHILAEVATKLIG
jgi:hypothetical protein